MYRPFYIVSTKKDPAIFAQGENLPLYIFIMGDRCKMRGVNGGQRD
jgi:hypothetical protein